MAPKTKYLINEKDYYIRDGKWWWLGKEPFSVLVNINRLPERFLGKHLRIKIEVLPETVPKDRSPKHSLERIERREAYAKEVEEAKLQMNKLWGDDDANKPVRDGDEYDRKGPITDDEVEELFEFFARGFD